MTNVLGFFLCSVITILSFLVFSSVLYFLLDKFFNGPYQKYKYNTRFFTMEEISQSITTVCNLQFMIYDRNRFREAGPKLNNASFENYYQELSKRCLESLSNDFYKKASMYMTEDAIALMISEMVRNYLTTKIGIDDSADYGEDEIE